MIAKRVLRGKAGAFKKLGVYILNPEKLEGASEWRRTAEYVIDLAGGGARSAAIRISNCHSEDVEWAIREIEAVQAQNKRARGNRTYHLVVSFPPGERPTQLQLHDIEDELCRAIGLHRHQRISAVHTDTEHLHMHIAINQVHPQSLACIEPWYDKRKLMRACRVLEIKHGLSRTNHGESKGERQPQAAGAIAAHRQAPSFLDWLRKEVRPGLLAALDTAKSWQELHAVLAAHQLEIKPRGAGLVIAVKNGTAHAKASSVDPKLSMKSLRRQFGVFIPSDDVAMRGVKRASYRERKVERGNQLGRLWTAYQQKRLAAKSAREAAMARIAADYRARMGGTEGWYRKMRELVLDTYALTSTGKKNEIARLDLKRAQEEVSWKAEASDKRRAARSAHPLPSWVTFLRQAAAEGDAETLAILRRNEDRSRQAIEARATGGGPEHPAVIEELRPEIRSDGAVAYRLRDGGVLVEKGGEAFLERMSPLAALLQLRLAAGDTPFDIGDNSGLVRAMIYTAAVEDVPVRFGKREHEAERQRLAALLRDDPSVRPVLAYIQQCEAQRAETSDARRYALWRQEEAPGAGFEKLVILQDGSRAALLSRGDTVFVKQLAEGEPPPAATAPAPAQSTPAPRRWRLWR